MNNCLWRKMIIAIDKYNRRSVELEQLVQELEETFDASSFGGELATEWYDHFTTLEIYLAHIKENLSVDLRDVDKAVHEMGAFLQANLNNYIDKS